jgi:hypothetical protein
MAFTPRRLMRGASGAGGYQISRSLRFNSADSTYLNKTLVTPTNNKIWTWSAWVKRASLGVTQRLFFANGVDNIWFNSDDTFYVYIGSGTYAISSVQVFRDTSAWYHIMITADTTQATSSNRLKMYVNGAQITSFSTATYPTQNYNTFINSAVAHGIGAYGVPGSQNYFDGYMTEVNFIDGQALTPSSFGETNVQTGVWQPKRYSGSYGTNGFYLNFSDNSNTTAATLGKDYSGNGNNWTPNNFSVTAGAGNDSLVDSPTSYGTDTGVGGTVRGNYATLNPLDVSGTGTILDGNLQLNGSSGAWYQSRCGFGLTSGKWYWEVYIVATNEAINGICIGIANSSVQTAGYNTANQWSYNNNNGGRKGLNTVSTAYGTTFITADTVGVAFDADAGSITFYVNNSSQGVAASSGLPNPAFPTVFAYGTDKVAINFGQRPFAYTAPSGFKALCTQNLPTPTIGATTATQAGKFFNTVLYTGDGANPRSITGVGFQPDFVWGKRRSFSGSHFLMDSVRGTQRSVASDASDAEIVNSPNGAVQSFDSDGATFQGSSTNNNLNNDAITYVTWNWKAGGTAVTNTSGSITSQVSASSTSGFSVVTWTNPASGVFTIGHGLGVAPSMVIFKDRQNAVGWTVYHVGIGNTGAVFLNTTGVVSTSSGYFNNTSPTSTVVTANQAGVGNANANMVAYCFAEIAGYSKFGSYTGNGSTDGPFVYTGFRPRYFLWKPSSAVGSWAVYDSVRNTYNVEKDGLWPNLASAEADFGSSYYVDFVSNGFKIRGGGAGFNASGETIIFAAFAENPFKYSLAR